LALGPFLLAAVTTSAAMAGDVTVVGFSDYHAHAVPLRSEGRVAQGGIARAIAFLKQEKARGAVIFSGGDTLNAGTPSWSDAYPCLEWPWLNGLVDAVALGNHELDYGPEVFARCRASADYPVLAANVVGADGAPVLTAGGRPYVVRQASGRRIGAFAVAGPDMERLVKVADRPAGWRFTDAVEAARAVVRTLREVEKVDAVVLIGHQHRADDEALARSVPGIDLVLGTHSHLRVDLQRIEGTATWYVAPFQYLTYASRVTLRFTGDRLADVKGGLVRMDESIVPDADVAARVAALQRELVARKPERFAPFARLGVELSDVGVSRSETPIGNWATGTLRRAAGAHVFLSTSSSFRASLGPGEVSEEDFFAALPYANRVVTATLTGVQVETLVGLVESRRGEDSFSQQSGLRWRVADGRPVEIEVLRSPGHPDQGFAPLDRAGSYRVATTDFQAFVVGGYKEIFAAAGDLTRTGLDVHTVLREALVRGQTAEGALDGRSVGTR
jgi:5'-nucleotidase/UDP-sugar diphosphatase